VTVHQWPDAAQIGEFEGRRMANRRQRLVMAGEIEREEGAAVVSAEKHGLPGLARDVTGAEKSGARPLRRGMNEVLVAPHRQEARCRVGDARAQPCRVAPVPTRPVDLGEGVEVAKHGGDTGIAAGQGQAVGGTLRYCMSTRPSAVIARSRRSDPVPSAAMDCFIALLLARTVWGRGPVYFNGSSGWIGRRTLVKSAGV